MVTPSSPVILAGVFLFGVVLVVWCVEVFIEAVAQSAISLGISGFFLAVVLAGIDLENAVLGVTAAVADLPGLAVGTVFGESLFVLTVAVGLAGIVVPFRMDVPRAYLLLLVVTPVPAFVLSLSGRLDFLDGAVLVGLFVPLLAYIFWHERRSETTYLLPEEVQEAIQLENRPGTEAADGGETGRQPLESDLDIDFDFDELVPSLEDRSGRFSLGVALLAVIGMTIGSGLTVYSAEGIFVALGISGLAFGATVLSFIASLEELALTLEPVRQGHPELAVGNVVGSTVFYTTANLGLVALLHPVATGGDVLTVHWPFLAGSLLLVSATLARGRVTRLSGIALIGWYVGYWIINYL
ncbi:sodium:calcium antiporter [Natrinema halophilum]|uniref:Sodium:calcium antiporter n=1 Tax=Natrinema halophilum TaxID=1699371 RepID=A0A7D5KQ47_9EURY|nr:sodium:calcium antiporter [Natrinema halophilum]QLG47977.1 sodium:calcium antiporter [Natrinema halophilum]